jgi:hypothetical protein
MAYKIKLTPGDHAQFQDRIWPVISWADAGTTMISLLNWVQVEPNSSPQPLRGPSRGDETACRPPPAVVILRPGTAGSGSCLMAEGPDV